MPTQGDLLDRAEQLKSLGRCQDAIDLYRRAASQDPFIYSLIGFIYHFGDGDVSKDLHAAIDCYQRGLDEKITPSLCRALLSAYCEMRFESLEHCEEYLEKIAGHDSPVAQLACLWLFALLFRSERSSEEQAEGRAYGEKAARMGNVHARKAMAEVYLAERKLLTAAWMYTRALISKLWLRLANPEDIRLQKY